ncbi:hypothetical protein Tco_1282755 [Tanacetum coccineum]
MIKDKGKAIMIEPEVPLKRKDQVALDKDLARNLQAQLEAELIEEEKLARKKEEEANIALIESWDNTQALMEADFDPMDSEEEKAKDIKKKILGKKRAGKEQQQESSKRQRMEDVIETDENEEVEEVDEAKLKKHLVIVKDDDIAIDSRYKFQEIFFKIRRLQGIDREDLLSTLEMIKDKSMVLQGLKSQKKQYRRKHRKDTTVTQEETQQDDSVPTPSNDLPLSGENNMQLSELMILCTNLQKQVLDLEKAKDAQAKEIADLKKRSRRVESSEDKDSLVDHENASKQGRSIKDIDKDADVSLVDDTQGRSDNEGMFDTNDLHGDEINVDMSVGEKQEQSVKEREVDTSVEDSAAPTTIEEITLAQTLIQIKAAKPKVVTTAATTTTTTTRLKVRGVVVQ